MKPERSAIDQKSAPQVSACLKKIENCTGFLHLRGGFELERMYVPVGLVLNFIASASIYIGAVRSLPISR